MKKQQWTVRPFDPSLDKPGWIKLWAGVSGFDGSVPLRTAAEVDARLQHRAHKRGAAWRVAVAGNGAIVGALEVGHVGTLRSEVWCAVNPAWRRQGIGRALLQEVPPERRALVTARGSVSGADELLTAEGFTERYREARMRRAAKGLSSMPIPEGGKVIIDPKKDVGRAVAALVEVYGEDAETDTPLVTAWLARPGCQVLYLTVAERNYGICVVSGSDRAKKNERDTNGDARIGVIDKVGLSKVMRGKGMSRPLIRAGLLALKDAGFEHLEVLVDRRKPSAAELYETEGFTTLDDEIHWMRKENEVTAPGQP
jgi:GNAT superfamily N-acetyltransferase